MKRLLFKLYVWLVLLKAKWLMLRLRLGERIEN